MRVCKWRQGLVREIERMCSIVIVLLRTGAWSSQMQRKSATPSQCAAQNATAPPRGSRVRTPLAHRYLYFYFQ